MMKELDNRNKIIMYLVNENKKLGGKLSSTETEEDDVIKDYENFILK